MLPCNRLAATLGDDMPSCILIATLCFRWIINVKTVICSRKLKTPLWLYHQAGHNIDVYEIKDNIWDLNILSNITTYDTCHHRPWSWLCQSYTRAFKKTTLLEENSYCEYNVGLPSNRFGLQRIPVLLHSRMLTENQTGQSVSGLKIDRVPSADRQTGVTIVGIKTQRQKYANKRNMSQVKTNRVICKKRFV